MSNYKESCTYREKVQSELNANIGGYMHALTTAIGCLKFFSSFVRVYRSRIVRSSEMLSC